MIHQTLTIPEGRTGTVRTLEEMERLVASGKRDPRVRSQMIREALTGVTERNSRDEVKAVIDWVQRRVRYVRDPIDIELIQTADHTLDRGHGDCDDFVILARSALESIGYKTRSKVVGPHREHYAHVLLEVYDPAARSWYAVDPIAKNKPFGWQPVGGVSEVYPTMGDDTAIMTGYPLRFQRRKTDAELMAMGYHPLWLDQRAEAAILMHDFRMRPGNYGPLEAPRGLELQGRYSMARWHAPGTHAVVSPDGRMMGAATRIDRNPFHPRAARAPGVSGLGGLGDLGALGGGSRSRRRRHHENIQRDLYGPILDLMKKYGGGPVLKGSVKLTPAGSIWKRDFKNMCGGEYPCDECFKIGQHPWVVSEQLEKAEDALINYIWYTPASYDHSKITVSPFADETGGTAAWFCWANAFDLQPSDVPNLPSGMLEEGKALLTKNVASWGKRAQRRYKRKKKHAKIAKTATIAVGALATVITGGLAAGALGAIGMKGAAAIAALPAVKGGAALVGSIGVQQLNREVTKGLKAAGIAKITSDNVNALLQGAEEVASGKLGATSGDPKIDSTIRDLKLKLENAVQQAVVAKQALADNQLTNSTPFNRPYPQGFAPQAFGPITGPVTVPEKKGISTGAMIGIGAAGLGVVGLILFLALRK